MVVCHVLCLNTYTSSQAKEIEKRKEIKIAYNQRNLDIKYSTNFNKTIINVKKAKMGICPKDVAKCSYSETIQQNVHVLKLDF